MFLRLMFRILKIWDVQKIQNYSYYAPNQQSRMTQVEERSLTGNGCPGIVNTLETKKYSRGCVQSFSARSEQKTLKKYDFPSISSWPEVEHTTKTC